MLHVTTDTCSLEPHLDTWVKRGHLCPMGHMGHSHLCINKVTKKVLLLIVTVVNCSLLVVEVIAINIFIDIRVETNFMPLRR